MPQHKLKSIYASTNVGQSCYTTLHCDATKTVVLHGKSDDTIWLIVHSENTVETINFIRASLMRPAAKVVLFLLCMVPVAWLTFGALTNSLGANPAETLIRSTGDWTLRFLCIVLAVTPLRVLFKLPALTRFRRMLGLFVYFYVVLHLASYAWLDMSLDIPSIVKDIVKRPFILVGFSAFVLLTPLAATSFNKAIKLLGSKRWKFLHKSVYAVSALGILHFFWMRAGKNNFAEVAVYAAIILMLLGWRLQHYVSTLRQSRGT